MKNYFLIVLFPVLLGHVPAVYADALFEGECISAKRTGHRGVYDNYIITNKCNKLVSFSRLNSRYYIEPNTTQELPMNGSHTIIGRKHTYKVTEHVEESKKRRGHSHPIGARVFTGVCLDVFYLGVDEFFTANNGVKVIRDKYDVFNQCAQEVYLSKSGRESKIPGKEKRLSPAFGFGVPYRDNTPSKKTFIRNHFVTLDAATVNRQPFQERLTKNITAKIYKRNPFPNRKSHVKKPEPTMPLEKRIGHKNEVTKAPQVAKKTHPKKTISNTPRKQTEAEWWGSDEDWDKKW